MATDAAASSPFKKVQIQRDNSVSLVFHLGFTFLVVRRVGLSSVSSLDSMGFGLNRDFFFLNLGGISLDLFEFFDPFLVHLHF